MNEPHEVSVLCRCDDIEHCTMELYVSDVRIAEAKLQLLNAALECSWHQYIGQKLELTA